MKTEELKRQLPPLYSQENVANPMVWVKCFHPLSEWTWSGIEDDEEDVFFGWVSGFEDELGYFSLKEMEGVGVMLGVERDLYSIGPHPRHATISPCRTPLTEDYRNLQGRTGGTAYWTSRGQGLVHLACVGGYRGGAGAPSTSRDMPQQSRLLVTACYWILPARHCRCSEAGSSCCGMGR